MSKAVLISIRPVWCQKIMAGRKTIEVRKTRPKMDTPFKCCIYCTNLEYRKNYVYPYRCLRNKAERFSEEEMERRFFSGEECKDFEQRGWPDGNDSGN